MVELSTLQYPRHLHRSGLYRIVADVAEAQTAVAEGWTLSPETAEPHEPSMSVEDEAQPTTAGEGAPPDVAPLVESPAAPDVPVRKKPGRPKKLKE